MGFRFRKSVKIAPGVKLNLSKKSASISVGTKGARFTTSTTGRKTASVGLPGTGLSYTKTISSNNSSRRAKKNTGVSISDANTINTSNYASSTNTSSNSSTLSLIFGILSWITGCCCCIGALFSILGIIFSKKGVNENGTNQVNSLGKWLSITGFLFQFVCLLFIVVLSPEETTQSTESISTTEIITASTTEFIPEFTTEITTAVTTEITTEVSTEITTELTTEATTEKKEETVWIPSSGSKYHKYSSCSGMDNATEVTKSKAESMGYTPCKRCH